MILKKYIIWPRMDQKTCFKAILTCGLIPIIIDGIINENTGAVETNISEIKTILTNANLNKYPAKEEILCILTTTSCFAPRISDNIIEISKLCLKHDLYHIVNNAYGVQSIKIMKNISKSSEIGRIDCFIQSTDKNFMVPVGGSIITICNQKSSNQQQQKFYSPKRNKKKNVKIYYKKFLKHIQVELIHHQFWIYL